MDSKEDLVKPPIKQSKMILNCLQVFLRLMLFLQSDSYIYNIIMYEMSQRKLKKI